MRLFCVYIRHKILAINKYITERYRARIHNGSRRRITATNAIVTGAGYWNLLQLLCVQRGVCVHRRNISQDDAAGGQWARLKEGKLLVWKFLRKEPRITIGNRKFIDQLALHGVKKTVLIPPTKDMLKNFGVTSRVTKGISYLSALCLLMTGIPVNAAEPTVPSGPIASIATPGHEWALSVQGQYVYAVDEGNKFDIFDIHDPSNPVLTSSTVIPTPGTYEPGFKVATQGSTAYIITQSQTASLQTFTLTDPVHPVPVSRSAGFSTPWGLVLQDHYAYITDEGSATLIVFDVSNPASPVRVGSTSMGLTAPGELVVSGNYAYIVDQGAGLVIIDISNPSMPVHVGSTANGLTNPLSIGLSGHDVYITDASPKLVKYDVTNPAAPALVGSVDTGLDSIPNAIAIQNGYAYVTDGANVQIDLFDLSGSLPALVGAAPLGYNTASSLILSLAVQGRYVYVMDSDNNKFLVFDFGDSALSDTTPPTITLTAPSGGSAVSGTVNVTASAIDNIGVSRVDFSVDGSPIGSSVAAPYAVLWDTAMYPNGSVHTLSASATDAAGNTSSASPVFVTVSDTVAPSVAIMAPVNNATVSGVVPVVASASDVSDIAKVEFSVDGTLIGTKTSAPYSLSWDTTSLVHNSSHLLTAKAYDTAGNSRVSAVVTVQVADVTPPAVSMTSPANGSVVKKDATITITATAGDASGIAKVEFSANGSLLCTDTVSPYACSWKVPKKAGVTYALQAKAYDAAGNVLSSFVSVLAK